MDELAKRLRDPSHITQRDGLAALFATCSEAADRIEALSKRPSREEVARIIDPDAWAYFGTGHHNSADLLRFDAWKQSSLRKADDILARIKGDDQ